MINFRGKSVYQGIAIGKLQFLKKKNDKIEEYNSNGSEFELERLEKALKEAVLQINDLKEKALKEVGQENAEIFEIHRLMLEDEDFLDSVKCFISSKKYTAEFAIHLSCQKFVDIFSSVNNSYMQARIIDIKDISKRLINILTGNDQVLVFEEPSILVAEELTPSETLQLDKSKILGFITSKGSTNSHTAILSRTMNIPAIIGLDLISHSEYDGELAVVDGINGAVYIEPDDFILEKYEIKLSEEKKEKQILQSFVGKENVTLDGKKIELYANIGNIKDLPTVLENDAGGIGLFRSEFIFLEKNTLPSEEEQFAIYKNAVETMNGKKVIIRTLDIGADKKVEYLNLNTEENPALGLRAIRLCIKNPDIFKSQLRALLRSAVFGNLSIMYPMITSTKELHEINRILLEATNELDRQGVAYKIPEQGIMIETPAAVMISDELAKQVSFFSIGTNDLSQYAMAIDRQNESLDDFFDAYHPAIIKMIEMTVANAHKNGIWVGVCGELASDPGMIKCLLELGVDELSVSPGMVLPIRKKILETNLL